MFILSKKKKNQNCIPLNLSYSAKWLFVTLGERKRNETIGQRDTQIIVRTHRDCESHAEYAKVF